MLTYPGTIEVKAFSWSDLLKIANRCIDSINASLNRELHATYLSDSALAIIALDYYFSSIEAFINFLAEIFIQPTEELENLVKRTFFEKIKMLSSKLSNSNKPINFQLENYGIEVDENGKYSGPLADLREKRNLINHSKSHIHDHSVRDISIAPLPFSQHGYVSETNEELHKKGIRSITTNDALEMKKYTISLIQYIHEQIKNVTSSTYTNTKYLVLPKDDIWAHLHKPEHNAKKKRLILFIEHGIGVQSVAMLSTTLY